MVATPKRKWLQLHLSTCIILMFVAAGILWLNMQPQSITPTVPGGSPFDEPWFMTPRREYGWPLSFINIFLAESYGGPTLLPIEFGIDAFCWLAIAALPTLLAEGLLRWRERS